MKLSENFTLEELCKSSTATRLGINNIPEEDEIIENLKYVAENILQPIREKFGVPFTPNSGYRSSELNKAIGSSDKSQHRKGEAVDIEVPTLDNSVLAHWIAVNLEFDQLILEYYKIGEPKSDGFMYPIKKKAIEKKY